jgi:hypothetical protein
MLGDDGSFLFLMGLAVLKTNQAALLAARDDDTVVRTLKAYFATLDDSLPSNGERRRTPRTHTHAPPHPRTRTHKTCCVWASLTQVRAGRSTGRAHGAGHARIPDASHAYHPRPARPLPPRVRVGAYPPPPPPGQVDMRSMRGAPRRTAWSTRWRISAARRRSAPSRTSVPSRTPSSVRRDGAACACGVAVADGQCPRQAMCTTRSRAASLLRARLPTAASANGAVAAAAPTGC